MADYTVSVRPPAGWLALPGTDGIPKKFDRADEQGTQEKTFKSALKGLLEKEARGSVASEPSKPTEPAIWLGYDEIKSIQLSKKKTAVSGPSEPCPLLV